MCKSRGAPRNHLYSVHMVLSIRISSVLLMIALCSFLLLNTCLSLLPPCIADKQAIDWNKNVARKFGKDSDGVLLKFKVTDLPDNVPYLVIDNNIADYLFESEVLLLPGHFQVLDNVKVNTNSGLKQYKCQYQPNVSNVNSFRKMQNRQIGGFPVSNDFPDIDLAGKVVVYWRLLNNRPVDIFRQYEFPNTEEGVITFYKECISKVDYYFDKATNMIPEYNDIIVYLNSPGAFESNEGDYIMNDKLSNSYNVYKAIIDPITGIVLTIHFGLYRRIFREVFDISKEPQVVSALQAWWKGTETKNAGYTFVNA